MSRHAAATPGGRRSPGELFAAARAAVRNVGAERLLLRAAALTYLTIVSLVPLLAVVLYALQALQFVDLQAPVRAFLFENLAVGVRENAAAALAQVADRAGSGEEGGLGVLLLLGTALLLIRNIEKAFDDLWSIHAPRPLAKALPRYLGLLLAGPVVLGLSLAITAGLRAWAEVEQVPFGGKLFSLAPFFLSAAGFTLLYVIAPAAKVRWVPAAIAGILAAAIWELAKLAFAQYATYSIKSDYLYGPLVAIPLFLVWIYLTWLIVLAGARLAFGIQHPAAFRIAGNTEALARVFEVSAIRLAVALAVAQREGRLIPSAHGLAVELGLPEGTIRSLLQATAAAGLVVVAKKDIRLARQADRIVLGEVLLAVRGQVRSRDFAADAAVQRLVGLLQQADRAAAASLELHRLSDVAEGLDGIVGVPLAKA